MDDSSTSAEDQWLRDRLGHGGHEPYPVVYSPAEPLALDALADPKGRDRSDELSPVAEQVLEKLTPGRRLVAVSDVEDDPKARAFAAVQLARQIAARARRVLLVDGDFAERGLARALGEEDEQGFVDLLRYGASVPATTRPSGLKGIDHMGVGSYRPEPSENFPEEDLRRGLAQLRQAYDVVILTVPAMVSDHRFHPFLVHADAVLLTSHLHGVSAQQFEETVEYLQGLAIPLAGIVAFAGGSRSEALPLSDVIDEDLWEEQAVPEEPDGPGFEEEESSSPLFRRLTLALAALLLVFAGWWGWTQWTGGDPARSIAEPTPGPEAPTLADAGSGTTPSEEADAVEPAEPDRPAPTIPETGQTADALVEGESEADPPDGVAGSSEIDEPFVESTPKEPMETPAEAPVDDPIEPPAADDEDWQAVERALRLTPGSGYALHLWSFPDSLEASGAVRPLVREGWGTAIRAAEIAGRGTWYRVLVGRFATRAAALDAREPVGERLDVEYVGVVRLP